MKASYCKHTLEFKIPGGTSRGVLTQKDTWFIVIRDGEAQGIGECGMFRGLSVDDRPDFESQLAKVCEDINLGPDIWLPRLTEFPSIRFGLEQAFYTLRAPAEFQLFPSKFTRGEDGIPINGLVWMGDLPFMETQVAEKIKNGFTCIKIKIGALDFATELNFLKRLRDRYGDTIELRVDANGAFAPERAAEKLLDLAPLKLHSIEQPIAPGQQDQLAAICSASPVPVALDEELIGVPTVAEKKRLLDTIKPAYIILKPTLLGGMASCNEWIRLAEQRSIGWWVTSALESNIGLNAIAQWTYNLRPGIPQGLGTGGLFKNNIESPLYIDAGSLNYHPKMTWDTVLINNLCI